MMSGFPPTALNARTGLFTPPTSNCSAACRSASDRDTDSVGRVTLRFPARLRLQPARCVFRMIGKNDACAGALDTGEDFQRHALLVDPAVARRGFDHRV